MFCCLIAAILTLTNSFGSARVDTHGARVVSYVPRGGSEVFATFADGTGGMPICAPYFASLGGVPSARRHGPARHQDFRVANIWQSDESSSVELVADSDEGTRRDFPCDYRMTAVVRLSRTLSVTLKIANTGTVPMPATPAFHPYFRVGDATRCRVRGLADESVAVTPGPARIFDFPSARRTYALEDPVLGRTLEFVSLGDSQVAVWTPGDAQTDDLKAKTTSHFRPGEWRRFVAVENGRLRRTSETVIQPNKTWTIARTIRDVAACPYGPDETALWQGRIDAAAAAGGGVVRIPAGEHTVAQLRLKSGVTLHLDRGAVLAASTDYADHPALPGEDRGAVVWSQEAERVAIEGEGTIDGRGGDMPVVGHWPGRWRGIHLIRCRDVRLEGFTLRNAHSWGCFLAACDGVVVRSVTIVNRMNLNNDGLDIASRNVVVEDCDIDAEDDGLVFKNFIPDFVVENVRVRNCRISSASSFIKIGTETWGGFRNIGVRDCVCDLTSPTRVRAPRKNQLSDLGCTTDWTGSDGLAVLAVDGGFIEDVSISDIVMKRGITVPLCVRLDNRSGRATGRASHIRKVLIENVRMEQSANSWLPCVITGASGLRPSDITIRNSVFKMLACPLAAELRTKPVPEAAGGYPSGSRFGVVTPAYGLFVRHADGVTLDNVRFDVEKPDLRRPVVREDAGDSAVSDGGFGPSDAAFALACASNLVANCTPRDAGTGGARKAADWILRAVRATGADARCDRFAAPMRRADGSVLPRDFTNVSAAFAASPDAPWIVLTSHYDTKPGVACPGANDGASTSGLLIALAARMARQGVPGDENVLLLWLDGEECVTSYGPDDGLWGAKRAASELIRRKADVRAVVCLDMLGDRDLAVSVPANGSAVLKGRARRAARRAGVPVALLAASVIDDHVPFLDAGFEAIDLIDTEYGSAPGLNDHWHTPSDTVDKLSPASLEKAGRLATELLRLNRSSLS